MKKSYRAGYLKICRIKGGLGTYPVSVDGDDLSYTGDIYGDYDTMEKQQFDMVIYATAA